MTTVTCLHRDRRWGLQAKGHATGSPEVCAAISALLQALAEYAAGQNALMSVRLEPGDAEVVVTEDVRMAYDLCVTGLELIAEGYGAYLEVHRSTDLTAQPQLTTAPYITTKHPIHPTKPQVL